MPYIKQERRPEIDKLLEPLIKHLESIPIEAQDGTVDYVITKIIKRIYQPKNFFTLNRALGVLIAVIQEFYRRVVAPYENKKMIENGDVS